MNANELTSSNKCYNENLIKKDLFVVPFPKIIDEISYYAKKKHAEIIYRKCIKYKKYELAKKIADNYRL